ncbi:MAG: flagellar basal body-associated protein FliL [Methylophilaceae bacterium]
MAQANPTPEAVPVKSRKKVLLLAAVLVAVVIAGAVGAWYMLQQKGHHAEAKHETPKPSVFVNLDTFTVNLQPDPNEQFLQMDIALQVADQEQADLIKLEMPKVRSRLLLLLSSKKSSEISSIKGKNQLTEEIIAQINQPFSPKAKGQNLLGVFFTSFVIQ